MDRNDDWGQTTNLMTTSDVALLLHVHINTVRRWENQGIIDAYRIGSRRDRRFTREDINGLLERVSNNR